MNENFQLPDIDQISNENNNDEEEQNLNLQNPNEINL